jgi:hypothetical protein
LEVKLVNSKIKNIIIYSSIGISSYIFTDVFHEVIGHGGACLLFGHKITLLTSVYFMSKPFSIITDLGGPAANILFGFVSYLVLKYRKNISVLFALLLLNVASYNFFWFAGTVLNSGISKIDDWTFAVKRLNAGGFEKPLLIIASILVYYLFIKLVEAEVKKVNLRFPRFPLKKSIYYSYIAASLAAVIAGLFYNPGRIHASLGALFEMIASVPILFIVNREVKGEEETKNYIPNSKTAIIYGVAAAVLFIAFCLTLGWGITS